mgnify:CR=1 FL=1
MVDNFITQGLFTTLVFIFCYSKLRDEDRIELNILRKIIYIFLLIMAVLNIFVHLMYLFTNIGDYNWYRFLILFIEIIAFINFIKIYKNNKDKIKKK